MVGVEGFDVTLVDNEDRPFHCSMNIGYNAFPEGIDIYSRKSSRKHQVERYVRERVTHNLLDDKFVCSECLHSAYVYNDEIPRYCPNCGRKVV